MAADIYLVLGSVSNTDSLTYPSQQPREQGTMMSPRSEIRKTRLGDVTESAQVQNYRRCGWDQDAASAAAVSMLPTALPRRLRKMIKVECG